MRRTLVGGLIFWAILILTASIGVIFMVVPMLPLMFVSPYWFRIVMDMMISSYAVFTAAMMELVYGIKIIHTGDRIDTSPSANNLMILNHRTRLDWMFFWGCLYRHSYLNLSNMKISLKEFPLKNLLGLGWATQFAAYIFMKRNFEQDKMTISQMLSYYQRVNKDVNMIYFPEGTDKCPHSTKRSRMFAEKNNLPDYEYVLHPRVTGFSFIAQEMLNGNFDSLYDVTVAYRRNIPQDEKAILMGEFPDEVHFHVKRYTKDTLPTEEEDWQQLCQNLWKDKEERLADFYTKDHKFHHDSEGTRSVHCDTTRWIWQIISMIYWFPFLFTTLYFIMTNTMILCYVVVSAIALSSASTLFGGFDSLQARL